SATKDSNYLFSVFMKMLRQKLLDDINTDTAQIKELDDINTYSELMSFLAKNNSSFDTLSPILTKYKLLFETLDADRIIKGAFSVQMDKEVDEQAALVIRTLMNEGVQLINTSLSFAPGPLTKEAIIDFGKTGGVIVKSGGNANVLISGQGIRNPDIVGNN